MNKLLLIGKNGQLGWELNRTLAPLGEVVAVDYPEVDLAKDAELRSYIQQVVPSLIINAAAYTNVDRAESEPDLTMNVNGTAPGVLAEEASNLNAGLIHFSTDYVFDGTKSEPYVESDAPNPINVYGMSKLAGEQTIQQVGGAYLIFRTSWVYSLRVGGFVNKVLKWAQERETLRIVSDQIGSPTWARMLAEVTAQVVAMSLPDPIAWINERKGLYHLGGDGEVSRLEFARAILEFDPTPEKRRAKGIEPALTSDFPTPAQRPLQTGLNCKLFKGTFGIKLPEWKYCLKLALDAYH